MDLILCHTTADFDALGAAVGLSRLHSRAKIVLTGGSHPAVREFLALHRDEYSLIEHRSVNPKHIKNLFIVDTQKRDRLGKCAVWLDLKSLDSIQIYDHHPDTDCDIIATYKYLQNVGSATTLIVELLQQNNIKLTVAEATVMGLGVHVDTGSLTYLGTTYRDAIALAWLIEQGASLKVIADYIDPGLSPNLQQLISDCIDNLHQEKLLGYNIAWVLIETANFVPGLSSLASRLADLTELDGLLFCHIYPVADEFRLTVIGRSRIPGTDLNPIFVPLGGGGHSQAVSLTLRSSNYQPIIDSLYQQFKQQIPHPLTARELMSSPVRTIRPETKITQAQRILLRYGHSGLSVVNDQDKLVGIISRRDLDLALHHGFNHAPVKGYMTPHLKTINPHTTLPEIEAIMVNYDIGRLPVVDDGKLVGIVTRTDVLRQLHQERHEKNDPSGENAIFPNCILPIKNLKERIKPALKQLLALAAKIAEEKGWNLYLVGGAVRDLLLAKNDDLLMIEDIDLVVDGFYQTADAAGGVELAKALRDIYSETRLEIHGQFQTAGLLWHKHEELGSLWVDIATARTEFYPYPAANPEVEASSIKQDLYRRDFTINALALRLTSGNNQNINDSPLLDFFGGVYDLQNRKIRVLHPNSFIEDPTRIYRAVKFAVRLGFTIETQTEKYIHHAIASGIYDKVQGENERAPALETRLKNELKYILESNYWQSALQLLAQLGALKCLHPNLELNPQLWRKICFLARCLPLMRKKLNFSGEFPQQTGTIFIFPEQKDWQIRLELIIASLSSEYRSKVAQNLQLPIDSIDRLQNLGNIEKEIRVKLPTCKYPSEIVKLFKQYDLEILILIAVRNQKSVRRIIWKYVSHWSQIKPLLNGHDLKLMGYKPGPHFKEILDRILSETLDGTITNKEAAIELINRYLQENNS
jgi:tRNA nucleotidyltransferase (CCA-adding enzyme)